MKSIRLKKLVLLVFIPLILVGFWIIASLVLNNTFSFSVLTYGHEKSSIESHNFEKLLKGNKITGEFVAPDNYLGIVILKFNSYLKFDFASTDYLIFRIKEKNSNSWIYENAYRAEMLQNQLHFPFGFPVINESKNKHYVFEIESSGGTEKTAINLNKQVPSLMTGYQYPKQEILGSKMRTANFVMKKALVSFTQFNFILSSLIYLLPLFVYLLILNGFLKRITNTITLSIIVFLLTIMDTFILREMNVGIFAILTISWIFLFRVTRVESSIFYKIAFAYIGIWLLCMVFRIESFNHKLNIWVYIFFVLGAVHSVLEEKKNYKKRISIREFITKKK